MHHALKTLFATVCGAATLCMAQTRPSGDVEAMLIGRPMASAVAELSKAPGDGMNDRQRFALGVAQTLRAIEKLQAGYHALGPRRDGMGQYIPMVRLMGNDTPPKRRSDDAVENTIDRVGEAIKSIAAVPVSADLIDAGLTQFGNDLAEALKTLDAIRDPAVSLSLPLLKLRLDVNGIAPGGEQSLADILKRINVIDARSEVLKDDLMVRLDAGDVAWLRGYIHLISAMNDFVLAYDKSDLIDTCGELFFRRVAHKPGYPENMRPLFPAFANIDIVDVIAFVHQLRLPVKDAKRMASARTHLLATIDQSRVSWDAILKETDNELEWIPNPSQKCVLPRMAVTQETVDGWLAFIDDGQAVLDGTKLIPFWRADDGRGLNVRKLFEQPPAFDLVMWVQGAPLGPYLEKGPLATAATYRRLDRLLGGDFFTFAIWVN